MNDDKRINIEDLPKAAEELTDDEEKNVEGGLDSRPGSGVLKSTDGGKTWAANTGEGSSGGAVVVDPSNPNVIY
jgi:hypothetical protein